MKSFLHSALSFTLLFAVTSFCITQRAEAIAVRCSVSDTFDPSHWVQAIEEAPPADPLAATYPNTADPELLQLACGGGPGGPGGGPTPTFTPTRTSTPTGPTPTFTRTPTVTRTRTVTHTRTSTGTPTRTNTPVNPTPTFTRTSTPSPTMHYEPGKLWVTLRPGIVPVCRTPVHGVCGLIEGDPQTFAPAFGTSFRKHTKASETLARTYLTTFPTYVDVPCLANVYKQDPNVELAAKILIGHSWTSGTGPDPEPTPTPTPTNTNSPGGIGAAMASCGFEDLNQECFALMLSGGSVVCPNDPNFAKQWGLHNYGQNSGSIDADFDVPEAWNEFNADLTSPPATPVIVAVVDSGIYQAHEEFSDAGKILPGVNAVPTIALNTNVDDGSGHGTQVTGIIAASMNNWSGITGIYPGVKILPIKVGGNNGSFYADDITKGLSWAIGDPLPDYPTFPANPQTNLPQVINMSFEIPRSIMTDDEERLLAKAIEHAYEYGIVLVAAAGNGACQAVPPGSCDSVSWPARYDNVIAVSATDRCDALAQFSNYGPQIDFAAPGDEIETTAKGGNNYVSTFKGTSPAAAYVSGVVALIKAYKPCLSNEEIRTLLEVSALPLPPGTTQVPNNEYGYGRVNAYNALLGAECVTSNDVMQLSRPASNANYSYDSGIAGLPHAEAVNAGGTVVGFTQGLTIATGQYTQHGAIWTNPATPAYAIPGASLGYPDKDVILKGINSAPTPRAVGYVDITANGTTPVGYVFTWNSSNSTWAPQRIKHPVSTPAYPDVEPVAVNNSGIVAGSAKMNNGSYHAIAYNAATDTTTDLNSMLGNPLQSFAADINNYNWILGTVILGDGTRRTFVLDFDSPSQSSFINLELSGVDGTFVQDMALNDGEALADLVFSMTAPVAGLPNINNGRALVWEWQPSTDTSVCNPGQFQKTVLPCLTDANGCTWGNFAADINGKNEIAGSDVSPGMRAVVWTKEFGVWVERVLDDVISDADDTNYNLMRAVGISDPGYLVGSSAYQGTQENSAYRALKK